MAEKGFLSNVSPTTVLIVGGLAVAGFAVYEILKGGSTSQSASQSAGTTSSPTSQSTTPTQNAPVITIPTVNPTISSTPTTGGAGGNVTANTAPVVYTYSINAPYTSTVIAPVTSTVTTTTNNNQKTTSSQVTTNNNQKTQTSTNIGTSGAFSGLNLNSQVLQSLLGSST